MKHTVMMVLVAAVWLAGAPLFGADEQNSEQVNPEVTKLIQKIGADIDQLAPIMPDGATEEDKAKVTEELGLLKSFVKTNLVPLCTNKVFVKEVAA